jgi:dTDP-4-amino-4,6-dideoxygalactose transaminase
MNWRVPLSDIDIGEEEVREVMKTLRSKWLTLGPVTKEFESKFSQYLGSKYAFGVSSGTSALHIAQRAIGITEGDEVILPSLTFVATANSVLYVGARPVFADIVSLDDLTISPDEIAKNITPKTKAIVVVHYGGYSCQMKEIMDIAKKNNLYVIEDASHAIGAEYMGKKLGTIGNIGCFSFFANKNMTTGEGGMIVTNSNKIANKIRLLRSHGMTTLAWDRYKGHSYTYDVVELGFNYRIGEINSALGIVQLSKLSKYNKRREEIVELYKKNLKEVSGIKIPFSKMNAKIKSSYHIFPIILDEGIARDKVLHQLREKGIQTSIHYPPIHKFTYHREILGDIFLNITEKVGMCEITLPLFPGMKDSDVNYVSESVKEVVCKL